ncbi:MAG: putative Ig domain-containing protein, partial [Nitrosomonadales bacterium]|nr:putative Ig domain-containing protein [Nitrosomonadales bacterium]
AADLAVSGGGANGGDLILSVGGASLTISGWFSSSSPPGIGQFSFTDGATLDAATVESMVNSAPVATAIPGQTASQGAAFIFQIPAGSFSDPDAGDTLSYSATLSDGAALPDWLAFDAATQTFSGTPGYLDAGSLNVRVTATDMGNLSVSEVFVVSVAGANLISGTGGDDYLSGTAEADTIDGLGGNDTLNGGAGADTMIGGAGNDYFYVDNAGDAVVEYAGEGTDTVYGSVNCALGANMERLYLTGAAEISGAGTELDNKITGNDANNTLAGGGGNDEIVGAYGADIMLGGAGDDICYVDNTGDTVIEYAGEGTDSVYSFISYTLGANTEKLYLLNSDAINAFGNELDNTVKGNTGANLVYGGAGNDYVSGRDGNDVMQGVAGDDTLYDIAGRDLFDGGADTDSLTGGADNGLFAGGAGNDTISAGDGTDIIVFNKGDGQDTLYGGIGTDNALSLGGGIGYADLALSKANDNLIVEVGAGEQITLANWYNTTANYKSVLNLQVVADAMAAYDPASSDPLLNHAVQNFDFMAIVNSFDQARGGSSTFLHWSAMNALLDAHLSSSDTEALGGDLAHFYGRNGSFTGMNLAAAQDTINAAQFGGAAQILRPLADLQTGAVRLS